MAREQVLSWRERATCLLSRCSPLKLAKYGGLHTTTSTLSYFYNIRQIVEKYVFFRKFRHFALQFDTDYFFAREFGAQKQRYYAVAATEIDYCIFGFATGHIGKQNGVGSKAVSVCVLLDFKIIALQIVDSYIHRIIVL